MSRSSTAEGTVIIQGFNPSKITCGASGYLRQEFCELEIMDEISQLRFEDCLPSIINGHLRNAIIRQYQNFKGELYVPEIVPDTLKWTISDPMNILKVQTDIPWCLIEKNKGTTVADKQNHQIGISGTRIFWTKLRMDSNSDGQIEPKNSLFIKFPRCFWYTKFFG